MGMKSLKSHLIGMGVLSGILVLSSVSFAQRGERRQRAEGQQNGANRWEQMQERQKQAVSEALDKAGLTGDDKTAAMDTWSKKAEARAKVMRAMMDLVRALREPNATDDQISTALSAYTDAESAMDQQVQDLDKALDAKIGYATKPKIHAALIVTGVVGRNGAPMLGMGGREGRRGGAPGAGGGQ